MVQREGRIMRRGNENREVNIYRYIVEGSFDSYSWQILQTKQHFISQFLSGNNTQRSIEDFENDELNYAQVKALALSEPLMKAYAEKENELRSAKLIYREELNAKKEDYEKQLTVEKEIGALCEEIEKTERNAEYVNASIEKLIERADELASKIKSKYDTAEPRDELCSYLEFKLICPDRWEKEKRIVLLERLGVAYRLELGETEAGNKTRIKNLFKNLHKQVTIKKDRKIELEKLNNTLKEQMMYDSGIREKIQRLETEVKEIFERISEKNT